MPNMWKKNFWMGGGGEIWQVHRKAGIILENHMSFLLKICELSMRMANIESNQCQIKEGGGG